MSSPESRHDTQPAHAKTTMPQQGAPSPRSVRTAHDPHLTPSTHPHRAQGARYTWHLCLAALACAVCATTMAQQAPLTGRMLGNQPQTTDTTPPAPPPRTPPATTHPAPSTHSGQQTSSAPSPTRAPMPAYTDMQTLGPQPDIADADLPPPYDAVFGTPIGGTTERLLHMQAHNRSAGPARPMLGNEAAAAYKRYIDSFKHPIPEFFQTKVADSSQSGSGR